MWDFIGEKRLCRRNLSGPTVKAICRRRAERGEEKLVQHVIVTSYDPRWKVMFEEEAEEIKRILGSELVAVCHIGSTAVEGLAAKPVIDIMPVVRSVQRTDNFNVQFEALGYECMGEFGIPGRRYYRKGGDERTHQIHIFEEANRHDIIRHLAVRDYLRSHRQDAELYGQLKRRLAQRFPYDIEGYCDGKDGFVRELEEKALRWYREQIAGSTEMAKRERGESR